MTVRGRLWSYSLNHDPHSRSQARSQYIYFIRQASVLVVCVWHIDLLVRAEAARASQLDLALRAVDRERPLDQAVDQTRPRLLLGRQLQLGAWHTQTRAKWEQKLRTQESGGGGSWGRGGAAH